MAKTNMTKYEKLSTILSILALVLALGSPMLAYFWLDPDLRNFKRRARLQVSGTRIDPETGKAPDAIDLSKGLDLPGLLRQQYELQMTNVGQLPGKDIKIVTTYGGIIDGTKSPSDFILQPPTPFDSEEKAGQTFITITRPLAPRDTLVLTFSLPPRTIAVSNEFGETTVLESTPLLKW